MNKAKSILITISISLVLALSISCGLSGEVDDNNVNRHSFTDERDGKTYKIVKIGKQTWMAENLNYDANDSVCYDNLNSNCDIYGRLYDWETAKVACPDGWHIPSNEDWDQLYFYASDSIDTSSYYNNTKTTVPTAGKHLKAKTGWNSSGTGLDICLDTYNFSALPGGRGLSDGGFYDVGDTGFWWSASEKDSNNAYSRFMSYELDYAFWDINNKTDLFSVRCVK